MEPPPEALFVVEHFSVDVALTVVREDEAILEQYALLLTLRGRRNQTTVEEQIVAALDTAGGAKLTGALLEALDRMRERSGSTPD